MGVSLFTSRIVLQALGVRDYGVYSVVGGIVVMFSVLNTSMSSATARFLSYEIGREKDDALNSVFNCAMAVHIIIAAVVFILAETIGLWFLNEKMVIPAESMYAANIVYQCTIIGAIVGFTQVPYSAFIMSKEKMAIFAYFDMSRTILNLGVVGLLLIIPTNKLALYGILTLCLSVLFALLYRLYCIRQFPACRLHFNFDRSYIRPMLYFSGWDLYGNASVVARTQGVNMTINIFFGSIANAAVGIATQVQGAVNSFANNVIVAIKPQIVKSYANQDFIYMRSLLYSGCKIAFLIIAFLATPLMIDIDFVLSVWLGQVPEYTPWICRWTLLFILFSNISYILVTGVHATGDVRPSSLINGTLYLSVLPITYYAYKMGISIYIPFVLNVCFVICGATANLFYVKRYVSIISLKDFFVDVLIRCISVFILSTIIPLLIYFELEAGWIRFISITATSFSSLALLAYFIALNNNERQFVKRYINRFISKFALVVR